MGRGVIFSDKAAGRISRVVKTVERNRRGGDPPGRRPSQILTIDGTPFTPNAEVPAYGVMDTDTGIDSEGVLATKQATVCGGLKPLFVNGPSIVASGDVGRCLSGHEPIQALYDTADGTPAVGEQWGVKASSWKLGIGIPGFEVLATGAGGIVWVRQSTINYCMGKPDADVVYSDTTGVTFSIWKDDWSADTGNNLSNVLPPKTMTTGTIADGENVWGVATRRGDGKWFFTLLPC